SPINPPKGDLKDCKTRHNRFIKKVTFLHFHLYHEKSPLGGFRGLPSKINNKYLFKKELRKCYSKFVNNSG
ncbi:MAG: hypothetical protein Q8O92_16475, partial [Candidatus Latescibacter sp.]|nr:hypothetical protein [Candidatus Latescibacter sp.]